MFSSVHIPSAPEAARDQQTRLLRARTRKEIFKRRPSERARRSPVFALASLDVLRKERAVHLDDADDDTEQAQGGAENFDDEHLHEQLRPLRVAEGAAGAGHADADAWLYKWKIKNCG